MDGLDVRRLALEVLLVDVAHAWGTTGAAPRSVLALEGEKRERETRGETHDSMSPTVLAPFDLGTRHAVNVFVPSKISSISSRVRPFVSGYMKN